MSNVGYIVVASLVMIRLEGNHNATLHVIFAYTTDDQSVASIFCVYVTLLR